MRACFFCFVTTVSLLNHDPVTINDIQAFGCWLLAVSYATTLQVVDFTSYIFRLTSYIGNAGGSSSHFTLGTKTTHSVGCTDGEFVLRRINGDVETAISGDTCELQA